MKGALDRCKCGHLRAWHWSGQCEFHCGNPERCPCPGFKKAAVDRLASSAPSSIDTPDNRTGQT